MKNNSRQILIESILSGMSVSNLYDGQGQYQDSFGVDPDDNSTFGFLNRTMTYKPMGAISPVSSYTYTGATAGSPNWITSIPRPQSTISPEKYVYDSAGSVYTIDGGGGYPALTGLGDLNDGGTASGNGSEYYDNYVYFARDTTIARYGPMDGVAGFTDSFWVSTLSKAALTNTQYPRGQYSTSVTPNHVMKRHNNGKLYISDVVGNQGTLHSISTTKTTAEGDTDNGSKFSALTFPYGYWPTSIESYGDQLVVALYNGNPVGSNVQQSGKRAKLAFWDGVSDTYNQLIDFQYPDAFIAKILNVNGQLYFFSGSKSQDLGLRICRYIGGISFEEIAYYPQTYLPLPGAYSSDLRRIYFGGNYQPVDPTNSEASYGRQDIKALGSRAGSLSGIFSVAGTASSTSTNITSINPDGGSPFGWAAVSGGGMSAKGIYGIYDNAHIEKTVWRSAHYRIGQPFKILKISIPLIHPLTSVTGASTTKQFTPTVWVDSGSFVNTLVTVNATNYPRVNRRVTIRPETLVGENDFFLHIEWDTDEPLSIALPILIEYEYLNT